ncbi:MAG TPA: glycosyltransferase family 9 protein [Stellaceae bacterium]|nr:glycosyltransferase family 9 protein [Stellaceae bacterium]
MLERPEHGRAVEAAGRVVETFLASIGSSDVAAHAAVFRAFEALETVVDLSALIRFRPQWRRAPPPPPRRNVLVIKLSALGDFIQALGPAMAIRRHHAGDRITLLTTEPYVALARETRLFDEILIDRRPKLWHASDWRALRHRLRAGQFDRVYDLQTSDRSSIYAWLLRPGRRPQWSGIAWRCSHPHANLERYPQHTIDKQAEQLLMAGIHPVPLPTCPRIARKLPPGLLDGGFVLLIPGSSPRHLEKRWPAPHFAKLARRLCEDGYLPVVVGAAEEQPIGAEIGAVCPAAVDLIGKTDLLDLARLAAGAAFTIGNDTGATHMAATAGNPVVVLFSQASEPSRCAPRGRLVRVLSEANLADLAIERVLAEAIDVASAARLRQH